MQFITNKASAKHLHKDDMHKDVKRNNGDSINIHFTLGLSSHT